MKQNRINRVDIQVSILTAVIVVISCGLIFLLNYRLTYNDMIFDLQSRVMNIYDFLDERLDKRAFTELNFFEDEERQVYKESKRLLENIKNATGVRYLYTAKRTDDGRYIYLVDGLPMRSEDFRNAGDLIEPEIIEEMRQALEGQMILPDEIKNTSWGYIFISYLPVYEEDVVVGVLGIEFDAEHQYKTFWLLKWLAPVVIISFCVIASGIAVVLFKRISNPNYRDFANTDLLTGQKNRNAFETDLHNLAQKGDRSRMGLLSADLDALKSVNDGFGHAAGDRYIREGSALLQSLLRPGEILYRIGGDEFAVVLSATSEQRMEELLSAMEAGMRALQARMEFPVGISAGYALFDSARDQDLFDTLRRSDVEMYRQKNRKKDVRDGAGG